MNKSQWDSLGIFEFASLHSFSLPSEEMPTYLVCIKSQEVPYLSSPILCRTYEKPAINHFLNAAFQDYAVSCFNESKLE